MAYIIGITGCAGSGKDTFATYLADELEGWAAVYVRSLAGPIRDVAIDLGFSDWRPVKESVTTREYGDVAEEVQEAINYALFGVSEEDRAHLYSYLIEAIGEEAEHTNRITASYRVLVQAIGEAGRKVRETFWTDLHKKRSGSADFVIIPDVRYLDEAMLCDTLVCVSRPGYFPLNDHGSESNYETLRELSTHRIANSRTLSDLQDDAVATAHDIIYNTVG